MRGLWRELWARPLLVSEVVAFNCQAASARMAEHICCKSLVWQPASVLALSLAPVEAQDKRQKSVRHFRWMTKLPRHPGLGGHLRPWAHRRYTPSVQTFFHRSPRALELSGRWIKRRVGDHRLQRWGVRDRASQQGWRAERASAVAWRRAGTWRVRGWALSHPSGAACGGLPRAKWPES